MDNTISEIDKKYMTMAIELAKKGEGVVNPNPQVGCVVVGRDGAVISTGYHKAYGEFHAERDALTNCQEDTSGATLYVTLEPCCHTGKTPPCTDIIIEKNIKRVVVGSDDPNPLVAGGGIQKLRDAGIEVTTGVLKKECDRLNQVFMHYITTRMPYVVMKYAMTLDGQIAAYTGDSKWVSGDESRAHVQSLRRRYSSILVGIGTVLADDPMLNYRESDDDRYQPVRIVMDSRLRIPTDSKLVETSKQYKTVVAYTSGEEDKISVLEQTGVILWKIEPDADGHVDIVKLLEKIGEENIDSVLVEGGASIHGAVLDAHNRHTDTGIINKLYVYIAPKIIGGGAYPPISGQGIPYMKNAIKPGYTDMKILGDDIVIEGDIED